MIDPTEKRFARKPATIKLKFHNRRIHESMRLPFVSAKRSEIGELSFSYWDVPKTGGYFGGNITGQALARLYLQHLKAMTNDTGGTLQQIVLDMLDLDSEGDEESDTRRGQVVGFFSELENWLSPAVKHLSGGLEQEEPNELLKLANTGLNFDETAWMKALEEADKNMVSGDQGAAA